MAHEIIVNKPVIGAPPDVILISGDAYVDHPSFGTAVIARVLQAAGYRVGVITQPDWRKRDGIALMGRPRLFFGITAGNLDSMLAHYTAFKKRRSDDAYTPGGKTGARPDRTCIVYANLVRQSFKDVPVVLGGIEASMRRTIHYDYWDDKLRESLLVDSGSDLLVYGMGEKTVTEVAAALAKDESLPQHIPGTAVRRPDAPENAVRLPSWRTYENDRAALVKAELQVRAHMHANYGHRPLAQRTRAGDWVVINRPQDPMNTRELDAVYELPFTRNAHHSYRDKIPGTDITDFSVVSHRGCGGGCAFCSLAAHQGRRIRSRSAASLGRELRSLVSHKRFKGTVADIGGPTANAYGYRCSLKSTEKCKRQSCFAPSLCRNFIQHGSGLLPVLKDAGRVKGTKHVHITSGIRHDLLLRNKPLLQRIISSHVSGQLKVAPEHTSDQVLKAMKKTSFREFERFMKVFDETSRQAGKKQFLVPYFISGHPGCRDKDMEELAAFLRKHRWKPQQVQAFIPLPGTLAAAYYYAGVDEYGNKLTSARTMEEKRHQMDMLRGSRGAEKSGTVKYRPVKVPKASGRRGGRTAMPKKYKKNRRSR